jgi:hypothetical protein
MGGKRGREGGGGGRGTEAKFEFHKPTTF